MHENMHLFADREGLHCGGDDSCLQTDRCMLPTRTTFGLRNVKVYPQTLK